MADKNFEVRKGLEVGNAAAGSVTYLTPNQLDINSTAIVNTEIIKLGDDININTTSVVVGNSTSNVHTNSESVAVGANVILGLSGILIGNSTVNVVSNSSQISVGANVYLTPSAVVAGNSSVNAVTNSTAFVIANSSGSYSPGFSAASNTAPSSPVIGQRWTDTTSGIQYTYMGATSGWVELGPGGQVPQYFPKGYLYGLTMNYTNSNTITVETGEAADIGGAVIMRQTAVLTKNVAASWSSGNNAGALDTGSVANTTYHVYLIRNASSNTCDILMSTSASAPTMPSGYTQKRRIGSILRASSAIRPFVQVDDKFTLNTPVDDRTSTAALSAQLFALSVPLGIKVFPFLRWRVSAASGASVNVSINAGAAAAGAANLRIAREVQTAADGASEATGVIDGTLATDTSARLYLSQENNTGTPNESVLTTFGWLDNRGRLG